MIWKKLLTLVGSKTLAKCLPEILAWCITQAFKYALKNNPEQVAKFEKLALDLADATQKTILAAKDGVFTADELMQLKAEWAEVFE